MIKNIWNLVRFAERLVEGKQQNGQRKTNTATAKALRKARKSLELDPTCWSSPSASEKKKKDQVYLIISIHMSFLVLLSLDQMTPIIRLMHILLLYQDDAQGC